MKLSHTASPVFRLRPLALLLAAIYAPSSMAAAAGRIEFSTNEPVVVSSNGQERPARKGDALLPGERVRTRSGRAQIAFTDGGFVSLQPNTEFGVEEYEFKGSNDGSEKSVFSLIKGALRTVTGLIGRSKRDAYIMRTPTATIGIRGTGGRIEVNDDGTLIQGTSGTWSLTNKAGSLDVPAGTGGFAGTDPNKAPEKTSKTPSMASFGTDGKFELPPTYSAGDQLGGFAPGMTNGAGYRVVYSDPGTGTPTVETSTSAVFSAGVVLSSFGTSSIGTAHAVEAGNDGLIGWGRWANGTAIINGTPVNLTANQGVPYVVGLPVTAMPASGSATYNLIGATSPTWLDGSGTGTLNSGSITVTFAGASSTLNYSLMATMGASTYTLSAGTVVGAGSGSFADAPSIVGGGAIGTCSGGCNGSVKGFFTGGTVERAGLTYKVYDANVTNSFTGAAAFSR